MKPLSQFFKSLSQLFDQYQTDIWLVFSLVLFTISTSFATSQLIDPIFFSVSDVWFESDINRVFENMTDRNKSYAWGNTHPLFPTVGFLSTFLFQTIFHLQPITATRITVSTVSGLIVGTMFILFRLLGYKKIEAVLFSILASATAAARFWFVVPETFLFGGETILLILCIVALAGYRKLSPCWYIAANIISASMTTTNWMAGIAATISGNRWKQWLKIFASALVIFILLATIQKIFFPTAALRAIFGPGSQLDYVSLPSSSNGLLERYRTFFFHSIVMPSIQIINCSSVADRGQVMSIQASGLGSGNWWGNVAIVAWVGLLVLGLYALFSLKQHPQFRFTLGLTLLGQLLLHSFHGFEIFLFSLHYAPSLVVLTSLSLLTRMRPVALGLALIVVVTAGINNALQFSNAIDILQNAHVISPEKVLLR